VYARKNEQDNAASEPMNFDWESGLMSSLCPLFHDAQKRRSKVLPKSRQDFAKFWNKKRRLIAVRFALEHLALSIARCER
jgi:hypothetical protein